MGRTNRVFSPEFRIRIAKRILDGGSVLELHRELKIPRSVLYRWRDAYRLDGAAGLRRPMGRPGKTSSPESPAGDENGQLRQRIAQLERKIGQQALQLDFFKRAFTRVKESSQSSGATGKTASTRRSGQ